MYQIESKLKELPNAPGVYIMKDINGEILYVGKAKILKNRVRQYFHKAGNKTEKVQAMVSKIFDFNYIITSTEKEALNLESNLIKKHKPFYNILLKDDKAYPYIKIDTKETYPKFSITRKLKNNGCKYFGPLMAGVRSKDILEILAICFNVRLCNINVAKVQKKHRACLNKHIGRCLGVCENNVSEETYNNHVKRAINFLGGDTKEVEVILKDKMQLASDNMDFELAIEYRTKLEMIKKLADKTISTIAKDIDMDVFAYYSNDIRGVMTSVLIRGGKIVASENYMLSSSTSHMTTEEIYSGFLSQYYDEPLKIPDEIILKNETDETLKEYLSELRGKKVNIICPKQGVRHQLVDMCINNASDYIDKAIEEEERKFTKTLGAMQALGDYIGVKKIRRMECYDISNISGTDKVASMVVFIDGVPTRSHYRRFKIKTVEGSNDFASMEEVLLRRLNHLTPDEKDISFSDKPDLIVIDGGKGQLSSSLKSLANACQNINMISLAKREEEVFLPNNSTPIIIPKTSMALKILQQIRDEAHRFAITYHRTLRQSHMLTSVLDEIEGVGKEKRKALIEHFKSLSKIKEASLQDLTEVKGISVKIASNIIKHLTQKE